MRRREETDKKEESKKNMWMETGEGGGERGWKVSGKPGEKERKGRG